MKHIGTKTYETERLILRPFTEDDAEAVFHNWASDDEVTKYLTWPRGIPLVRELLYSAVFHCVSLSMGNRAEKYP